jgi:6-pyruvoyltetrahydropterin/6-carboxytetrahydropterin synthase
MKLNVCKIVTFDSAHRLPNYNGPCANLHGHQWVLEVEVSGEADPETGMVIDFVVLKDLLKTKIVDKLDHSYINDSFTNPTAENMVQSFVALIELHFGWCAITLERIRLYETPTSFCEWRREAVE